MDTGFHATSACTDAYGSFYCDVTICAPLSEAVYIPVQESKVLIAAWLRVQALPQATHNEDRCDCRLLCPCSGPLRGQRHPGGPRQDDVHGCLLADVRWGHRCKGSLPSIVESAV